MDFQLRPYQDATVDAILDDINSPKPCKGLAVLPTGTGKSYIIAGVADRYPGPVLVLQPSKELLEQNHEKFCLTGSTASIYSASFGKKDIGHVTFATLGSVIKAIAEFKGMKDLLVICDEAHYKYPPEKGSQFRRFLDGVKPRFLYGLTATPFRLSNSMAGSSLKIITRTRPKVFNKIIYVQQIAEAIDLGFWAPSVDERWAYDDTELDLNTSGTDYTDQSIKAANEANSVNRSIALRIHELLKEGHRKSILVFTDSVDSAKIFAEYFAKYTSTGFVCGETKKKDRKLLVDGFKSGEISVLFNYGVFTVGFDHPALDATFMGRPTNSLATFYQIYGRAVRVFEGKEDFLFVDCCDNFGKLCHPREIVVEEDPVAGWAVFAGEKLITNVILGGPTVTKTDLRQNQETELKNLDGEKMPFGKWKGKKITEMCKWDPAYVKYMIEPIDTTQYGPRLTKLQNG